MKEIDIYQVDAFSGQLFGGNPAAVCPLDAWLGDELMQHIAAENNLSETAFFVENSAGFSIRWFTPTNEVKLCGHATLASAYVIFNHIKPELNEIIFDSLSGPLIVKRQENNLIQLNFPVIPSWQIERLPEVSAALGATPNKLYQSKQDYVAVFNDEKTIKEIQPDFSQLMKLDLRGISVTAASGRYDFSSRYFVPKCGVNEDPVTGSAHCVLAPFWANQLDKNQLIAYQASKRGGANSV
ncbi:PhzF family phenazine biosynthesis protein [Piscirickettsia litoralis]|uniref:PhzF family phenazine biosynthesis protein n=1 Tax=Piscirickettsia litoralis TaxID=1891921 RepID=UPI000B230E73|nr:PhzF family phenazine biosynthesis protein [Piscirickettsia litoralis]